MTEYVTEYVVLLHHWGNYTATITPDRFDLYNVYVSSNLVI